MQNNNSINIVIIFVAINISADKFNLTIQSISKEILAKIIINQYQLMNSRQKTAVSQAKTIKQVLNTKNEEQFSEVAQESSCINITPTTVVINPESKSRPYSCQISQRDPIQQQYNFDSSRANAQFSIQNRRTDDQKSKKQVSYITYQELKDIQTKYFENQSKKTQNKTKQEKSKISKSDITAQPLIKSEKLVWVNKEFDEMQNLNTVQKQEEKQKINKKQQFNNTLLINKQDPQFFIIQEKVYPRFNHIDLIVEFSLKRRQYFQLCRKIILDEKYQQLQRKKDNNTNMKNNSNNSYFQTVYEQNSIKYRIESLGSMTRLSVYIYKDKKFKIWKDIQLPSKHTINNITKLRVIQKNHGKVQIYFNSYEFLFDLRPVVDEFPRKYMLLGDLNIKKIELGNLPPYADIGSSGCDSKCSIF